MEKVIENLEFNSIIDASILLRNEKDITAFLMEFIQQSLEQKKGGFIPLVKSKDSTMLNTDFDLIFISLYKYFEQKNLSKNQLANLKYLLFQQSKEEIQKNKTFMLSVLHRYGLVVLPKNTFLYVKVLYRNEEDGNYFLHNSTGLFVSSLIQYVGTEIYEKYLEPLSGIKTSVIALSPKYIIRERKKLRISETDIREYKVQF
ncbi:hypothetical protein CP985_10310 [Malaciobacter mytili LMG 24559]|uniref:Uncharacterized protein n=1 Tax=Malaciobacter mytili LMG 24559 TaxID=1032238 RepID=A0AAX2AGQ5_9BACT|nr:hypothetical protein [Malaciobacter mytili]AXH16428.1 hypothetical protein AMYT_a0130 [Malaciobacter mytili LMG 24559]RXK15088.1 hypothetical protein CP985_10310 [Malaciobacter mytili LMG 24559]